MSGGRKTASPKAAAKPATKPGRRATAGPALVHVDDPIRTVCGRPQPTKWQQHLGPLSRKHTRRAALPAPVQVHSSGPSGPVTVPPTVLPQRGISAGFDPRFQCDPTVRPPSAVFSQLGPGRYLPDEPKPQPPRPPEQAAISATALPAKPPQPVTAPPAMRAPKKARKPS